jgi:hypothetical protein
MKSISYGNRTDEKAQAPISGTRTIGVSELARILGISRERVYQLEREGKIAREPDGKFDLDKVRADLNRNLDIRQKSPARGDRPASIGGDEATNPLGVSGANTLAGVQLQHEIAKAMKAQLEVKRLKGILVDAGQVKQEVSEMISAARSRALVIPSKLAPLVAHETDVRACHAIIEREIKAFLTSMAEYRPAT